VEGLVIRDHPSPNCGLRRGGLKPQLIVLHYTAMPSADAAMARMCDPATEVSAHYIISMSGNVTRLVSEDRRAWHAGAGQWRGQEDINSRSIGIELDNDGKTPFSEPLMTALEALLRDIMVRWAIPPHGVIAHSDMAPGRKADPGAKFDWDRLARQSLARPAGSGPEPRTIDPASFRALAQRAGYTADVAFDVLLAAVRLRYRPYAKGPLHPQDAVVLGNVAGPAQS